MQKDPVFLALKMLRDNWKGIQQPLGTESELQPIASKETEASVL